MENEVCFCAHSAHYVVVAMMGGGEVSNAGGDDHLDGAALTEIELFSIS